MAVGLRAAGVHGGPGEAIRWRAIKQVPAQEGELRLDSLLVRVQERCIVPPRQANQLSAGRSPRGSDGGPSKSGLILIARQDQQRTSYAGRVAARTVEPDAERGAAATTCFQSERRWSGSSAGGVQCVRRREQRDGAGLADQRHQQGLVADQAAESVQDPAAGEAQQRERRRVAHRAARGGLPVGGRRLGDRRSELWIARRDAKNMAARDGETPDREPGPVYSRQGGGELDRGLPVGELLSDPHDLARLPAAPP
jgi:hypothetical protein